MMGLRRGRIVLGAGLPVSVVLAAASVAWACTQQAKIALDVSSGPALTAVNVTGSHFAPGNGPIQVRWDDPGGTVLAAPSPSYQGSFVVPVKIPQGSSLGDHVIRASQQNYGNVATFNVTAPAGPTSAPAGTFAGRATPPNATAPGPAVVAPGSTTAAPAAVARNPIAHPAPVKLPTPSATPTADAAVSLATPDVTTPTPQAETIAPTPAAKALANTPTAASVPASRSYVAPALGGLALIVAGAVTAFVIRAIRRRRLQA